MEPHLWPDETVAGALEGHVLGAAASRLAGLDRRDAAAAPGRSVTIVATDQRLLVVDRRTGELLWQVQLPRLSVDLHGLPARLVLWSAGRHLAIELDPTADPASLLHHLGAAR